MCECVNLRVCVFRVRVEEIVFTWLQLAETRKNGTVNILDL